MLRLIKTKLRIRSPKKNPRRRMQRKMKRRRNLKRKMPRLLRNLKSPIVQKLLTPARKPPIKLHLQIRKLQRPDLKRQKARRKKR